MSKDLTDWCAIVALPAGIILIAMLLYSAFIASPTYQAGECVWYAGVRQRIIKAGKYDLVLQWIKYPDMITIVNKDSAYLNWAECP